MTKLQLKSMQDYIDEQLKDVDTKDYTLEHDLLVHLYNMLEVARCCGG